MGEPATFEYGYAKGLLEYNERGDCIKQTYLDINGDPVNSFQGCAVLSADYDERGNMTRMDFFGADGNLITSDIGAASVVFHYDSRGYGTGMSYFGVNGEPVAADKGCASMMLEMDERGNMIDLYYLDVEGNILTKKSLCILTVYPGSVAEGYGVLAGDYIVEYNGWAYFDNDPGDTYSYYYSFLMELISTFETENRMLVCRPSTGDFIEFDFDSIPDFEFEEEMWIPDVDYASMEAAYAAYCAQ